MELSLDTIPPIFDHRSQGRPSFIVNGFCSLMK